MVHPNLSGPVVFVRWTLSDGWVVRSISENVRDVLGHEASDLVDEGVAWASLIHPEDLDDLLEAADGLVRREANAKLKTMYRVRHAQGAWVRVLEHVEVEDDGDGEPCFVGYVLDVTEVVERDQTLEETRLLLEGVSTLARVGGWTIDLKTQALEWTRVTREIHEVPDTYEPLLGEALKFYRDGESKERIIEAVTRAMTTGEGYDVEVELVSWTGQHRWVRARGDVVFEGDAPVRIYGSFQDIHDRKEAQLKLEASEARWRFALEEAGDGVWEWDLVADLVETSARWEARLGYAASADPLSAERYLERFVPADRALLRGHVEACAEGKRDGFHLRCRVQDAEGNVRHVLLRCRVLDQDRKGQSNRLLGIYTDVTDTVLDEEARYRRLVHQLREVVFRTDAQGRWTFLNPAWEALTGFPVSVALGREALDIVVPEDRASVSSRLVALSDASEEGSVPFECRVRTRDGGYRWVQAQVAVDADAEASSEAVALGRPGFVGSFLDVTERRAQAEAVRRLAYFDVSTGLCNRRHFLETLETLLDREREHSGLVGLLLLDLDDFKTVNDTLGHDAGDALLRRVGATLQGLVVSPNVLARVGGDEFAILVAPLPPEHDRAAAELEALGARLLQAFRVPLVVSMGPEPTQVFEANATLSLGAVVTAPGTSAEDCLKRADLALYRSKHQGRNRLTFFAPAMQFAFEERTILAHDLRVALEEGGVALALQGQFNQEGALVGAEVLARWIHAERGPIAPDVFIPVAEQTGLVVRLGRQVLQEAVRILKSWQTHPSYNGLSLSVNVSVRELREPGFVPYVVALIKEAALEPGRLTLELTESVFVEDVERVARKLNQLREAGVRLSIDDFGTGYSSLAYLKRLPIDELKIDRAFVRDLGRSTEDEQIVHAILVLAEALGLHVVAEGVEDEAQLAFLAQAGCASFQGWHFQKPCAADEFARRIESGWESAE